MRGRGRNRRWNCTRIANLVALLALAVASAAWADPASDALALLRAGRPEEAYRLLQPFASRPDAGLQTQLMLGIAALESGHADAAIAALESVLARAPGLTAARAELARAYLALGRYADASRELKRTLAENPPPQTVPALQRLLATAESGARAASVGVLNAYVEAGYGHDSNLTAVTSNFTSGVQAAYGLPGFQPTGNSVMRQTGYAQTAAGADYLRPIGPNWAFAAGIEAMWRGYEHYSAYDQSTGDLRVGAVYAAGRHLLRLTADTQRYAQQTEAAGATKTTANRSTGGLSADWRYKLDPYYSVGLFLASNRLRFPDNRVLDADELQLGYSLTRRFDGPANVALTISPSYTEDHALSAIPGSATGANYSKTVAGTRFSGQFDPAGNVTAYASLGFFASKDASDFARSTLIARGLDKQADYALGASWRFAHNWSARAQLSRTDSHSNIALYTYERNEMFVGLRYDLR